MTGWPADKIDRTLRLAKFMQNEALVKLWRAIDARPTDRFLRSLVGREEEVAQFYAAQVCATYWHEADVSDERVGAAVALVSGRRVSAQEVSQLRDQVEHLAVRGVLQSPGSLTRAARAAQAARDAARRADASGSSAARDMALPGESATIH